MEFIKWTPALSVGFEEIDEDHKKLVEIVNRLNDAVEAEEDLSTIGGIIEDLLSYTSWHFRHEERLMQSHGDPSFFDHKQEHMDLLSQAADIKKRFYAGDQAVPEEMLPFLKDWLMHHILETDRKTGQFLAEKTS